MLGIYYPKQILAPEYMMSSQNPSLNLWYGIPRDQIEWFPTVVAERCNGCGLCVTTCGKNVYAFDYEANKPVVVAPQACMVGCSTCATNCTTDAIEFPSQGYVRQVIKTNKVLTQSKNMLKADPDKYDIRKRGPLAG
jgi:NAD-dependent dihydropyrimidine dehydrogenase PreA subunit